MKAKNLFKSVMAGMVMMVAAQCGMTTGAQAAYEAEDNNTMAAANEIAFGEVVSGALSSKDDEDWYKFTVTDKGYFTVNFGPDASVNASDIGHGWEVQIQDERRNEVKSYEDVKTEFNTPKLTMEPGVYYLRIIPDYPDEFCVPHGCQYNIVVNFQADNSWSLDRMDGVSEKTFKVGQTVRGVALDRNDEDIFKVNPGKKGRLKISFKIDKNVSTDKIDQGWVIEIANKDKKLLKSDASVVSDKDFEVDYEGNVFITVKSVYLWGAIDCPYSISVKKFEAPKAPREFKVKSSKKGIMLSWKKVKNAKRYVVYRKSNKAYSDYEVLKSTKKTYWVDKTCNKVWTYYYKVAAIDKKGAMEAESKCSIEKRAKRK